MTRFFIVFGLAVLFTFDPLPAWMVAAGGLAFGGAVTYRLFKHLEDTNAN